jgi:hypothetical protein
MDDLFRKMDSEDNPTKAHLMFCIDRYCKSNPVSYTYIGIGSAMSGNMKPTDSNDQIIPKFLNKYIQTSSQVPNKIRCINFDPCFAHDHVARAVHEYHTDNRYGFSFELVYFNQMIQIWKTPDNLIESIIISTDFISADDIWFIENYVKHTCDTLNKLVVQIYTGNSLFIERTTIYALLSDTEKEIFRHKVLIDISVDGLSCDFCGCGFDLSVWEPLYTDHQMTDFIDTMKKRTDPRYNV